MIAQLIDTNRSILSKVTLSGILLFNATISIAENVISLRYIDATEIPTGTQFNHKAFGGISGIDLNKDGHYYAISDARGGYNGNPRFYQLTLTYDANHFTSAKITSEILLKRPDGTPFTARRATVDPESISVAPNGNLYWSSEGNYSSNTAKLFNPFIREMTINGEYVRDLPVPTMYNYADNTTTGGRNNRLLESLTVDAKGAIYFANEDALAQDGKVASQTNASVVRLTKINPLSGNMLKQYAYKLPKIPMEGIGNLSFLQVNGLTDILAIGTNRFITIERAFVAGVGSTIKLVETTITPETTDISQMHTLDNAVYTPMTRKELLVMPPEYMGLKTDNIEGLTWGKRLANGNRTLILVSDNNFSAKQTTMFLAFEVTEQKAAAN